MNKYDALYILPEALKEDEALKVWDAIKAEVQKMGGVIQSDKAPSRRGFARTLGKKNYGYYAEITMEMDPAGVDPLVKKHKIDDRIFRVMITESCGRGLQPEASPEEESHHHQRSDG